ncbi:MAG: universal stress protein [Nocardioidaceae bacterium]
MIAIEPGSVVVGVDGTVHSAHALAWAVDLAVFRHAPLCVLHGAIHPAGEQVPFGSAAGDLLTRASQRVTDHALALVRRKAPDLEVTVHAAYEDPRHVLLEAHDAGMIVVGSRGRGVVASLLLGSVSLAVVSHARCPVTVMRPGRSGPPRERGDVVVGVDVDHSAREALELGFEIAAMSKRPLVALHAWSAHDTFIDTASYQQRLDIRTGHERRFAHLMGEVQDKHPEVPVTRTLVDDRAVQALVNASHQASHLVLGRRHSQRLPHYVGSVSRAVVEHSDCPVSVASCVLPHHARGRS